jgi:YHS domain-containing protein
MPATRGYDISTGGAVSFEKDPVCGARVTASGAAAHEDHAGRTYYFCSHSCHERFKANPEFYAARLTGPR